VLVAPKKLDTAIMAQTLAGLMASRQTMFVGQTVTPTPNAANMQKWLGLSAH
jgi:hypothetical protein